MFVSHRFPSITFLLFYELRANNDSELGDKQVTARSSYGSINLLQDVQSKKASNEKRGKTSSRQRSPRRVPHQGFRIRKRRSGRPDSSPSRCLAVAAAAVALPNSAQSLIVGCRAPRMPKGSSLTYVRKDCQREGLSPKGL